MIGSRTEQGWRATALAVALFAITLNFLQPLAHAALMRDGSLASSPLWTAMCLPAATPDDAQGSAPPAGEPHECCLGLAHAPVLAEPSLDFQVSEFTAGAVRLAASTDMPTPTGIRDGPNQPRAPPSFV